MVQIVATPEQAQVLREHADELIEIVDVHGNRLGVFARPFSESDIEVARRRVESDEPRLTTQQVFERLAKPRES